MMRTSFVGWAFAGLTAAASPGTFEGLRIVSSESFPAGTKLTTEYIASDRARMEGRLESRTEYGRAQQQHFVHIRRCDLDELIVLNVRARTYQSVALGAELTRLDRGLLMLGRRNRASSPSPDIVVETKTIDTGERRVAFGRPARRVVTTRRQFAASNPDAADETVTDGWYIDLDTRLSCERASRGRAVLIAVVRGSGGRMDSPRVAFKDVGDPEEGFPIEVTTTSNLPHSGERSRIPEVITRTVITDLVQDRFESSLFEVPTGFRCEDPRFSGLAAAWNRKANIIRTVVASWFH